jgi:hypothetical protein
MYTAQMYGHDVEVYTVGSSGGLSPDCYVNNGVDEPDGSVATVNGWLYVANGDGNDVLVYRTKHGLPQGPEQSLTDANFPTNVDVNPSRQAVAVSNSGTSSENGNVYIYLHRESVKSRVLTFGSGTIYGAGIARSSSFRSATAAERSLLRESARSAAWSSTSPTTSTISTPTAASGRAPEPRTARIQLNCQAVQSHSWVPRT